MLWLKGAGRVTQPADNGAGSTSMCLGTTGSSLQQPDMGVLKKLLESLYGFDTMSS